MLNKHSVFSMLVLFASLCIFWAFLISIYLFIDISYIYMYGFPIYIMHINHLIFVIFVGICFSLEFCHNTVMIYILPTIFSLTDSAWQIFS